MNVTKVTLKAIFFGLAIVVLAVAIGIGWYYRNPVFLGPYQIPNWDRPVYFEFPIVSDSFENPNEDLSVHIRENVSYNKVMLLDIDPS